jgi:hypothetical protein
MPTFTREAKMAAQVTEVTEKYISLLPRDLRRLFFEIKELHVSLTAAEDSTLPEQGYKDFDVLLEQVNNRLKEFGL